MKSTKRIFILSGAGLSAPSGIKTFRSSDGLWLWNGKKNIRIIPFC